MSKDEMIKEIATNIYETIYDPWTENVTIESIIEDIKADPIEIMYTMANRIKELYQALDEA